MPALAASLVVLLLSVAAVPPAAVTGHGPWHGRLQIVHGVFVDDRGVPQLPLCAHFAEAFSAWTRRPADVDAQLRAIKAAGYDCIRFWDNLGEYQEAWRGKEVTPFTWTTAEGVRIPSTPDYYPKLTGFLSLVDRVGLTVHHSRGDLGRTSPAIPLDQVVAHSRRVAEIYDRVGWHLLALYEGNNEDFQNGNFGPQALARIVEPLGSRGALVASSCPGRCSEDPDAVREYSRGFSVRYLHGTRDGDAVDRLVRKFTSGYAAPPEAPRLGWDGEPIGPNDDAGPGVTVNHTEDVEELALLHAMTFVGGRSAATYMSQHGVFWNGPIHEQSGFFATPRLRAALAGFARDVMRWPLHHGAQAEAVLKSPDGYADGTAASRGPARIDQAVHPDRRRAVAFIYGGAAPRRVRNEMACTARIDVIGARDDEQLGRETRELAAGEVMTVDYRVGRLLLASCVRRVE